MRRGEVMFVPEKLEPMEKKPVELIGVGIIIGGGEIIPGWGEITPINKE